MTRNRVTWTCYVQLSLYACISVTFGACIVALRQELGWSLSTTGAHGTAWAAGFIVGATAVASVSYPRQRSTLLSLSTCLVTVGTCVISAAQDAAVSLVGSVVVGCGGALLTAGVNAALADTHADEKARALGEAAAAAALSAMCGPLLLAAAAASGLGWRWVLPSLATGLVVLEISRLPHRALFNTSSGAGTATRTPRPARRGRAISARDAAPRRTTSLDSTARLVTLGLGTACETAVLFWGVAMIIAATDLDASRAAAASVVVIGGIAVGRVGASRLLTKNAYREITLLACQATCVLALLSYSMASSAVGVIGSLVAFGLGASLFWPLGVARALDAPPVSGTKLAGRAAVATGLGNALGPGLVGAVADAIGLRIAVTVALVGLLILAALVTALARTAEQGDVSRVPRVRARARAASSELVSEASRTKDV